MNAERKEAMAEGKSHSDVREAETTELMRGSNVEEGFWETIHQCCAPTSMFWSLSSSL